MPPPLHNGRPLSRVWARLTRQTVTDRSLTVLTLLLLAEVVLLPPLVQTGWLDRHLADTVFVAGLMLGVWILADHTLPGRMFIWTALASLLLRLANIWLPDSQLRLADAGFAMVNAAALAWLTLAYTLAAGQINIHRVLGAIAVFLLVGIAFAQAHRIVAMQAEAAYLFLGAPVTYSQLVPHLNYFSFVTLTSLGFGDITPAHPAARALTILEALIGVLYPAALLGWLVSLVARPKSANDE